MWDFEIGRTLGNVICTLPFVVFRTILCLGVTVAQLILNRARF